MSGQLEFDKLYYKQMPCQPWPIRPELYFGLYEIELMKWAKLKSVELISVPFKWMQEPAIFRAFVRDFDTAEQLQNEIHSRIENIQSILTYDEYGHKWNLEVYEL